MPVSLLSGKAAAWALLVGAVGTGALGSGSDPSDGSGAYATGHYRNLFVEDGHPVSAVRAKIEATYRQLFHGDAETQAIAFDAGANTDGPLMYLTDWANHDVRTEGMSYGMMIAVELGK
jgi:oligosaccharide reducing-end xylanase